MSAESNRTHRICFTGHRPEKISRNERNIISDLEKEILQDINDGFSVFISGMSRGVDIWAAEIVLRYRSAGLNVRLICACPYKGFENKWGFSWKNRYNAVLRKADFVKYVSENTARTVFKSKMNGWLTVLPKLLRYLTGKAAELPTQLNML